MPRIHQPCCLVQHPPVVVLPPLLGLTRVQGHARTQRRDRAPPLALQCLLCGHRGRDGRRRRRKHRVKTITSALDDMTIVGLDRAGDQQVVTCQRPTHRRRLLVPQRSRTLKIREEEGDRPRRKPTHKTTPLPRKRHTIARRGDLTKPLTSPRRAAVPSCP